LKENHDGGILKAGRNRFACHTPHEWEGDRHSQAKENGGIGSKVVDQIKKLLKM
jgi:hypothetical protein